MSQLSLYQIKLRQIYAIIFNYPGGCQAVPEQLEDEKMEQSVAHWMGYHRQNHKNLDSLFYALDQLLSDVESSISGQAGAHRSAIAKVRSCVEKVQQGVS